MRRSRWGTAPGLHGARGEDTSFRRCRPPGAGAGSAWAFHALADGTPVTLDVVEGRIVDLETGSVWAGFRSQTGSWSVPTRWG